MTTYDTICLSGGGIKGFAFIGALDYLENQNILNIDSIKNWVGTSAGAIISYLYVLGYTTQEIGDFILNFNFQKIEPNITIDNLLEFHGFDNGEKFMYILTNFLKEKFNIDQITFAQLYELVQKKLTIIGTNFSKGCETIFNHEKTPNMSVLLAVRISMSIPVIFTPVLLDNDYYVDGGIINNFPIRYCNPKTTLGIYIRNGFSNPLNNVLNIINGCLGIVSDVISEKDIDANNLNIIQIDNFKQEFTNFNIDQDKKLRIINLGQVYAKKFIDNSKYKICQSILNDIIKSI